MSDSDLDALYALAPGEFIAQRDAMAKELAAGGDRAAAQAVKTLKKPTQAGWALNLLAREATDELAGLVEVGAALRSAQEQLSGPQLRELSQQRQAVVRALANRARTLAKDAGSPLTEQVAEQVRQSLDAALTDAALGEVLLEGHNTGVLEYASGGFGAPLQVLPGRGPSTSGHGAGRTTDDAPSPAEVKRRKQEAAAELKRLRKAVADARRAHTAKEHKRVELETLLEAAHLQVAAAQRALDAALAEEEDVESRLDTARSEETAAAEELDQAEADLPDPD